VTESPLLLTVEEAAALLRIGRNTAYELIAQGALPHVRLGRLIRVPRHSVEGSGVDSAHEQPAPRR
jgi:excisionase family DNA binding protein